MDRIAGQVMTERVSSSRLEELIEICEHTISPPGMKTDTIDTHAALRELRERRAVAEGMITATSLHEPQGGGM